MSSDSTFVLIFRASAGVGELSRVFTLSGVTTGLLSRWIAATMPLLNDAEGIAGRAKVHKDAMIKEGTQQGPYLEFAAFVRALAEVSAPAALLYATWPDRASDPSNSIRGRVFAPACDAVPLDHAQKRMLPSMATFLTEHDRLSQSVCDDWGATKYGPYALPNEPWVKRRDTFPDGGRVTRMAPIPRSSIDAAPPAESAVTRGLAVLAAKGASTKEVVAAKDAPAKGAVAAKGAKAREIKKLDLPVGGDKIAYDFGAVKSDLHRARMRYVEPTDTALVRNLWRLYAGCEASMTLLRNPDRDPLAAHEFAFAAGRMRGELEESLAEFYGTYAIEE